MMQNYVESLKAGRVPFGFIDECPPFADGGPLPGGKAWGAAKNGACPLRETWESPTFVSARTYI